MSNILKDLKQVPRDVPVCPAYCCDGQANNKNCPSQLAKEVADFEMFTSISAYLANRPDNLLALSK